MNFTNGKYPIICCYAQHGLGSASWGAECLEKDKLYPEPFTFTWKIFGTEKESLAERAEQYRRK